MSSLLGSHIKLNIQQKEKKNNVGSETTPYIY